MFILSKLLGDNYQSRILEVLIENYKDEFTIPDIIEIAETSRGSTYSYIKSLVNENIIAETKKISSTQLYKLNLKNPTVKSLILLEHNLIKEKIGKEIIEERKISVSIPTEKIQKEIIGLVFDNRGIAKAPVVYIPSIVSEKEYTKGDFKWKKGKTTIKI